MPTAARRDLGLLLTAGVHAGFQLTVTGVVYPALAAVPAADWHRRHAEHSRRITPLVGVVYLPLGLATAAALLHRRDLPTLVSAAASGSVVALTAAGAAPLHRRLAAGPDPVLVGRLLRVDRWRAVGACVAALAAAAAAAVPTRG